MASSLIPCAGCGCHAKSFETRCPCCGEELRRKDGSLPRAAAAVLLGLTVAAQAGCPFASAYGPGQTTGAGGTTTGNTSSSASGHVGGGGNGGSDGGDGG